MQRSRLLCVLVTKSQFFSPTHSAVNLQEMIFKDRTIAQMVSYVTLCSIGIKLHQLKAQQQIRLVGADQAQTLHSARQIYVTDHSPRSCLHLMMHQSFLSTVSLDCLTFLLSDFSLCQIIALSVFTF